MRVEVDSMRDAARAAWCCLVLLRRSQLAGADGVAGGCGSKNIGRRRGGDGKVSLESVRNAALPGFGILRRGGTRPFRRELERTSTHKLGSNDCERCRREYTIA